MKKTIQLSVILEAIEEIMDGWRQFYNVVTGEVKSIPSWDNSYVETVCCLYHQKKDFISVPYEPKNVE